MSADERIEELRQALLEQWEYNHFEHCGRTWPHPEGAFCGWPQPVVLGGDPDAYRIYDYL